jgi:hypothetical protein
MGIIASRMHGIIASRMHGIIASNPDALCPMRYAPCPMPLMSAPNMATALGVVLDLEHASCGVLHRHNAEGACDYGLPCALCLKRPRLGVGSGTPAAGFTFGSQVARLALALALGGSVPSRWGRCLACVWLVSDLRLTCV